MTAVRTVAPSFFVTFTVATFPVFVTVAQSSLELAAVRSPVEAAVRVLPVASASSLKYRAEGVITRLLAV